MKENKLREFLNEGKPTLGTHVVTPWPGIAEVIGHSGAFHYIEYVGEYSPFSLEQLDNFGRAIELFPNMSSMMKVDEQGRGFIATRAIDAGIQNVLFTDCRSVEDVKECIRLVRAETSPEHGTHGCGMRRNVGYVIEAGSKAWTEAMDEVVIAIMIEKKGAMEDLEQILSEKDVDMVQFGPSDYSISIGKPGQEESQEIKMVEKDMINRAKKIDKLYKVRAEIVSFDEAERYIEMEVRHFCIGWDLVTIYDWCKQQGEGMRNLFAKIKA